MVGDEIVRHRLSSRIIHWTVGLLFLVCLLSGLPIWTPVFGWMAGLLGGLAVCRVASSLGGPAVLRRHGGHVPPLAGRTCGSRPEDREWLGPKVLAYVTYAEHDDRRSASTTAARSSSSSRSPWAPSGSSLSGIVLWFPRASRSSCGVAGILLHDVTFILFAVAVVLHIYLPRPPSRAPTAR